MTVEEAMAVLRRMPPDAELKVAKGTHALEDVTVKSLLEGERGKVVVVVPR